MHERDLKLVYKNRNKFTFNDLLKLDNSVTIYQRNLQSDTCNRNIQGKK